MSSQGKHSSYLETKCARDKIVITMAQGNKASNKYGGKS